MSDKIGNSRDINSKSVKVVRVTDANVGSFIYDKDDSRTSRQRTSKATGTDGPDSIDLLDEIIQLADQELPSELIDSSSRPSALLGDQGSEHADIGFRTPKKRNAMLLKAQISASRFSTPDKAENENTPKRRDSHIKRKSCSRTPSRRHSIAQTPNKMCTMDDTSQERKLRKNYNSSSNILLNSQHASEHVLKRVERGGTPKTSAGLCVINNTPHHLRVKTRAMLRKHCKSPESEDDGEDDGEDSMESSDSSSEDEDLSSNANKSVPSRKSELTFSVPSKKSAQRSVVNDVDCDFKSEAFFHTQCSKSLTSNNTLGRLRNPRLKEDTFHNLLSEVEITHRDIVSHLADDYLKLAKRLLFSLWEGFSVMLYGLGSKYHLIQSLHRQLLVGYNVVVVNGFFPKITLKEVLESILVDIMGESNISADNLVNVDLIATIQSRHQADPLYLLVHNMDGPALRNERAQTALSRLARVPNIYLIASIDHINAALMWDQSKLRHYNFVWWDVTTFAPYVEETSFESSLLLQQSGALTLSSLRSVFQSLTQNAKKLFLMIAKNQLEHGNNHNFQGIAFKALYWKCREAYIASTDGALRAQLTEFVDHHLVKYRRGLDGVESLIIPMDKGILSQFTENYEDELK